LRDDTASPTIGAVTRTESPDPRPHPALRLERRAIDLVLRHPWTLSRNSSRSKSNVLTRISRGPVVGLGEAAPNVRYREDQASVMEALSAFEPLLGDDPERFGEAIDRIEAALPGRHAAKAAVDIALHDLHGRLTGTPLWRLLGADPAQAPRTSFSIGLDTIPVMQAKVREAAAFPILKIKVGGPNDRATLEAIRRVTDKPLYVDANEGWTDRNQAIEMIRWMEGIGVVLIEQPLPAADLDGAKAVRDAVSMPIFADEAVLTADDIPPLAAAYDGINIKLQKAGGLRMARRMVHVARSLKMQVMIGCMIETSIGITAAAHLAPLVDHADLDGNLLVADDPFRGVMVRDGRLVLPEGPGLGVEPVFGAEGEW